MRVEHVAVGFIIFVVVLLAALIVLGKVFPTFSEGLGFIKDIIFPK